MQAQSEDARAVRHAMMDEVDWAQQHEAQIHYSQSGTRDNWLHGNPNKHMNLPAALDCSSYATYLIWRASGADPKLDPSGYNFNAVGNSSSIANHARNQKLVVNKTEARRGDLVVWPGKHVAVLVQAPSSDPKGPIDHLGMGANVSSHGQEAGPLRISLSIEVDYEGVKPIFVRTVPLDYKQKNKH